MADSDSTSRRTISFIVPAYNEEAELPATLRAIHRAAAGNNYEIVVVDDGSSDKTASMAQHLGARVIRINRRHIAAARNVGAQAAIGDFFIFVDADTRISRQHVEGAIQAIGNGYAGGGARLMIDRAIPRWAKLFFALFTVVYFGANLGAGAFLFTTRQNFFNIGGFDERYFAGEEIHFTIALKGRGRFKVLPLRAITSGRKLRLYSARQIFGRGLRLLMGGPRALTSREKLDLWYAGERESGGHLSD